MDMKLFHEFVRGSSHVISSTEDIIDYMLLNKKTRESNTEICEEVLEKINDTIQQ